MLGPIHQLILLGAADPMVPNAERIVLRPTQVIDMVEYLILVGIRNPDGSVRPFDVYPFGSSVVVEPPSWILVFTGSGTNQVNTWDKTGEKVFNFFMNRPTTILAPGVVPILVHMAGYTFGPAVPELPPPPATPHAVGQRPATR